MRFTGTCSDLTWLSSYGWAGLVARAPPAPNACLPLPIMLMFTCLWTTLHCLALPGPQVCSDINKPNGQYCLPGSREAVAAFVATLPIRKVRA